MTPKFPLSQMYKVEWEDSASDGKWRQPESYREVNNLQCRSVGFLLTKNSKMVQLIQSMAENGQVTDCISIPAKCVKKMRRLK
jgi:hypothetical protein